VPTASHYRQIPWKEERFFQKKEKEKKRKNVEILHDVQTDATFYTLGELHQDNVGGIYRIQVPMETDATGQRPKNKKK
jgi:hypothetical protein